MKGLEERFSDIARSCEGVAASSFWRQVGDLEIQRDRWVVVNDCWYF
jgi:hypothetical protein